MEEFAQLFEKNQNVILCMLSIIAVALKMYSLQLIQEILHGRFIVKISFYCFVNFSIANLSGTSSVAPENGAFSAISSKIFLQIVGKSSLLARY